MATWAQTPSAVNPIQTSDTELPCCCNKLSVEVNRSHPHYCPAGPLVSGGRFGLSSWQSVHVRPPSSRRWLSHQSISEGGVCSLGRGPRLPAGDCWAHNASRVRQKHGLAPGRDAAFKIKALSRTWSLHFFNFMIVLAQKRYHSWRVLSVVVRWSLLTKQW